MKKILTGILVIAMIAVLAACGKKEEPGNSGNTEITQEADTNRDAEPTKAAEPTAKPTSAPTAAPEPDPTDEPEPVVEPDPVDEPVDDPEPDDDAFDDRTPGGKFGDSLTLDEDPSSMDYVFITYFGVYCENTLHPEESFFYPYYGDYMAEETADEQNLAYLYFSPRDDGQLCFLEKHINSDNAKTDIEGSKLKVEVDGETYYGEIYWDYELQREYFCLHIDKYNLWLSFGAVDTREVSDNLGSGTESGTETGTESGRTDAEYFTIDPYTELFTMDTSLFGSSYSDFCKKLGRDDLAAPEDWPWWGKNLKVVYVDVDGDTVACFFQNNRFVIAYRDAAADISENNMYPAAVDEFGEPDNEYMHWSGYYAYEWYKSDCTYDQHVELYSDNEAHYRQQYTWNNYSE
jgi:predicted small lipoprotein YifL